LPKDFKMSSYSKDSIIVVVVHGRVDSESSPELEKSVLALLQRGERYMILDLAAVDYMASSGMRVLLAVAKKCQSAEARFVLTGLSRFVHDVLAMTGFIDYFEVFSDVDAAVAAMGA
jgi:anti-anti-sigma factor